MADNNKKNDLIATMLSSPDAVVNDFIENGINSTNTVLAPKEEYKKFPKIQEAFTNKETGAFDDSKFNTFYDHAVYTYNDLNKKTENNSIIDNIKYYDDQVFVPKKENAYKSQAYIERTSNPYKQVIGFEGFNKASDPKLSIRELAQQSEVKDYKTGDSLGWTPNDSMFSALLHEPVAVATWDEDGEHIDSITGKKVKHYAGENKLDNEGNFYYETLGGRSPQNKQILNLTDTLTEDGSWANKWDFMDSDGLDKSISGTIMKTAFSVVPYFIPGVRNVYTLYNTGVELMDAIPALTKAISGLTGKDLDDIGFLNQAQSTARKLKSQDVSDYAAQKPFGIENIAKIVSDSFGQLASQRLIASIPSKLGASSKDVSKFHSTIAKLLGEEQAQAFKLASYDDQIGVLNQLRKKSPDIESFMKNMEFWNTKGSKSISSIYMALTSATSTLEDAKGAGLDDQDAAMYYMGNVAGLYGLMNYTEIGHWALKGLGLDEVNSAVNKVVKSRSKEALKPFMNLAKGEATKTAEEVTKGAKLLNIFNSARKGVGGVAKKVWNADLDANQYLYSALAEGTEEVSEEMLADALKLVHNGLNKVGLTSSEEGVGFDFTLSDIATRYGMSFIGGGIGGMVFKAHDNVLAKGTKQTDKDLMWLIRNGYGDKVKDKINTLRDKSVFGSRSLSPQVYSAENFSLDEEAYVPTSDYKNSQNDIVADMLINEVNYIDNIMKQNDIPSDQFLNKAYNDRIENIIDLGLNSALLDDAEIISQKIIDAQADINSIERPIDTAPEEEKEKYKRAVAQKQAVLEQHRKELIDIVNGNSLPKYFKEAYFATHGHLNHAFGIKNINDFAKAKFNKFYSELSPEDQEAVNIEYDDYNDSSKTSKRNRLQAALNRYNQIEGEILKVKNKLDRISQNRVVSFNEEETDPDTVADILLSGEAEQFYLPRFSTEFSDKKSDTYSELKKRQISAQSQMIGFTDPSFNIYAKKEDFDKIVQSEYDKFGLDFDNNYLKALATSKVLREQIGVRNTNGVNRLLSEDSVIALMNNTDAINRDYNNYLQRLNEASNLADSPEKINDIIEERKVLETLNNKSISELNQQDIDYLNSIGFSQESIDQYQNLLNNKDQIVSVIDKFKNEVRNDIGLTPFIDILRNSSVSTDDNNTTRVLDLLKKYRGKLEDQNADLSKFVISNKIDAEQLNKIKELIEQIVVTSQALSDNGNTLGVISNSILQKNGIESPYENNLLNAEQLYHLTEEANKMTQQINFMIELSKYNQGDKINYDKSVSIAYRLSSISSIIPDGYNNIFNLISFLNEDDFQDPSIKSSYDYIYQKSNLLMEKKMMDTESSMDIDLSDGEYSEFEKHILNLEKFVYNRFQSLDIDTKQKYIQDLYYNTSRQSYKDAIDDIKTKLATETNSDTIKELNNNLKDIESKIRLDIKTKLDQKQDLSPTKFNATLDNFNLIDQVSYLLEILSNPPQGFYVMLKGNVDEEGKSDFSKTKLAPLQVQETLLRKAFTEVVSNNNEFNPLEAFYSNLREDYFDLDAKNTIYSNVFETGVKAVGIAGSGKSVSISTLARILENAGKKTFIYSPVQRVSNNLFNIIGKRSNIINSNEKDSRIFSDLSKRILGEELYNKAVESIKNETIGVYTEGTNIRSLDNNHVIRIQSKSEYIYKLNINNEDVKRALSNIDSTIFQDASAIIIDEFTHLNPVDLDILEYAIRNHNNNLKEGQNKISVIFSGDDSQEGYKAKIGGTEGTVSNIVCHTAPKMTDTIRSGFNVKVDNINSLLSIQTSIANAMYNNQHDLNAVKSLILNNNIILGYNNDSELGVVGDKITNEINIDELKEILPKINGSIGVIVSDLNNNTVTKINQLPEDIKSRIEIVKADNVQGSEFEFTIIDVDPINYEQNSNWTAFNAIKQLYTLISRSKQGSLILNTSIPKGFNIDSSDSGIDSSRAEFDPNQIEEYKTFREDVLNNVVENEVYDVPKPTRYIKPMEAPTPAVVSDREVREWNTRDLARAFELASIPNDGSFGDVNTYVLANDEVRVLNEFNKNKLFSYPFHQRSSILSINGNSVPDIINLDEYALYNASYNKKGNDANSINSNYKEDVTVIKRALLSKLTNPELVDYSLEELVENFKNGITSEYDIDFSNYELVVESRLSNEFTNNTSYVSKIWKPESGQYKVINFINARFKDSKGKDIFITLSALPNLNNENVSKYPEVKQKMEEFEADFYDYVKDMSDSDKSQASLIRKINFKEVKELSGIKFIKHKESADNKSLSEFRSQNENILKISQPYIMANFDVIGNSIPNKRNYAGTPFVIISMNPNARITELLDRYQSNIIDINSNYENTEEPISINKDTYIMFLKTKKIPFSNWIRTIHNSIENRIKGRETEDTKTLEHESQSAKLVTNLVNNIQYLNYIINNNKRSDFQNEIISNIIKNYYDNKIEEKDLRNIFEDIYTRIFNVLNLNKSLDRDFFIKLNKDVKDKVINNNTKLNRINDAIVNQINSELSSIDSFKGNEKISTSGLLNLLNMAYNQDDPTYRMLSSYDNIKKYKFTAILEAMIYGRNFNGSKSTGNTESKYVGTDLEFNIELYNMLVSEDIFSNRDKVVDTNLYTKAVASKKTSESLDKVFAINTINNESDFIVDVEVIPSSIMFDINDIDIEPISESDRKIFEQRQKTKDRIYRHKNDFNKLGFDVSNLDFNKSYDELVSDIDDSISSKIVNNNFDVYFGFKFDGNKTTYKKVSDIISKDLSEAAKVSYDILPDNKVSANLYKENGFLFSSIEIDLSTGNTTKVDFDNPNIETNSNILNIFVEKYNISDPAVLQMINNIDKELEPETFSEALNEILSLNGLETKISYKDEVVEIKEGNKIESVLISNEKISKYLSELSSMNLSEELNSNLNALMETLIQNSVVDSLEQIDSFINSDLIISEISNLDTDMKNKFMDNLSKIFETLKC